MIKSFNYYCARHNNYNALILRGNYIAAGMYEMIGAQYCNRSSMPSFSGV